MRRCEDKPLLKLQPLHTCQPKGLRVLWGRVEVGESSYPFSPRWSQGACGRSLCLLAIDLLPSPQQPRQQSRNNTCRENTVEHTSPSN
jgi:hypothetical protein